MMSFRCLAVACCLFMAPVGAADALDIQVRVNRLHGLLDLAYSYCGGPYESAALQQALESAGHRSGEAPEAVVRFCTMDIHRGGVGVPGRPLAYATWGSSPWDHFLRASVTSADMAQFIDATAGVLMFEEQRAVIEVMHDMAPLYDRLIETPFGAQARAHGEALSAYLHEHAVGSLLQQVAGLYAVPWPDDMPLWVGLSPTPSGSQEFSAWVQGNVVRSFLPVDYDRLDIYAGVMAHEYAHVLFSNLSTDAVQRLRVAFAQSDAPGRRFAEVWLNEALATAAGNGWLHWKLTGEANPGEWYSDPVIDRYAKAIAPAVHAALESGATLDEALVADIVAQFERVFPDAWNDPAVVLPHAMLIVDADATSKVELDRRYRNRVQTRALRVEPASIGDDAGGDWLPTVLRVSVSAAETSTPRWQRRILHDGGLEFSVRIASVESFDAALDGLIARIGKSDW